MIKTILLISIIFLLFSCNTESTKKNNTKNQNFECKEYWLPKNTQWDTAYDDILYCSEAILMNNTDSNWGINFPGSIVLTNDTLYINQEAGYENICINLGKLEIGDSVYIGEKKINLLFVILNDSVIEYSDVKYAKCKREVKNGCWCIWE